MAIYDISLKNQLTNYQSIYIIDFCRKKKSFTSFTLVQIIRRKILKMLSIIYIFLGENLVSYKKLCLTLIMCNTNFSKQTKY